MSRERIQGDVPEIDETAAKAAQRDASQRGATEYGGRVSGPRSIDENWLAATLDLRGRASREPAAAAKSTDLSRNPAVITGLLPPPARAPVQSDAHRRCPAPAQTGSEGHCTPMQPRDTGTKPARAARTPPSPRWRQASPERYPTGLIAPTPGCRTFSDSSGLARRGGPAAPWASPRNLSPDSVPRLNHAACPHCEADAPILPLSAHQQGQPQLRPEIAHFVANALQPNDGALTLAFRISPHVGIPTGRLQRIESSLSDATRAWQRGLSYLTDWENHKPPAQAVNAARYEISTIFATSVKIGSGID